MLPGSGSISSIWVPFSAPSAPGGIDEADLHALIGQIERLMDLRRAHDVAVKRDGVRDGGRGDADVVEAA